MELSQSEKELFAKSRSTGDRPPNIRHGKYLLMVDKWYLLRGYRNVLSDVHNFIILRSEANLVIEQDEHGNPRERRDVPNEVGSRCGVVFKQDGKSTEMAIINSTRFTLALLGMGDADISDEDKLAYWMRLTNDEPKKCLGERMEDGALIPATNPTRGMLIAAETTPILTKESKRWIVGINFIHVAMPGFGDNAYDVAARRWAEYEARLKVAA